MLHSPFIILLFPIEYFSQAVSTRPALTSRIETVRRALKGA